MYLEPVGGGDALADHDAQFLALQLHILHHKKSAPCTQQGWMRRLAVASNALGYALKSDAQTPVECRLAEVIHGIPRTQYTVAVFLRRGGEAEVGHSPLPPGSPET